MFTACEYEGEALSVYIITNYTVLLIGQIYFLELSIYYFKHFWKGLLFQC